MKKTPTKRMRVWDGGYRIVIPGTGRWTFCKVVAFAPTRHEAHEIIARARDAESKHYGNCEYLSFPPTEIFPKRG